MANGADRGQIHPMVNVDRIVAGGPCTACRSRGGEMNQLTKLFEVCRVCGGKRWVETVIALEELRQLLRGPA